MSKKQVENGYFKKYYQDHKDYFNQRVKQGYYKQYRKDNKNSLQEYRDKNKIKFNDYLLKRNYNISLEEYNKLFVEQEGKCAICGKHQSEFKRAFGVDHNHITGKIRGLLCINCNLSLGHAKDDIETLLKMVDYLNKEIEALNLQEKKIN